ncbi:MULTISPECIES: flagellar hook-associated protein FlgK [Nitrosomonas]|uniref:Flagellar hook-associated protein 1 n=2 Tax=Nitrosomonas eutropha TaxID=916 RepID=A0ABX5M8T2_9PROT|nr:MULTISPECIES: flagellar hook-associated protein FlgK [Nitrosomonas]ABI58624.1 flagellar hook-associated protein FlgK [Nitrosomonas eutropha C91]MXS80431.1 flagellar hook-associated protein FlgK [Nitrosomonas sp. GH22]PXV79693.1 flagellar hook-associated protein 1 FlgK [Nitrosomonas eutropha]SDW95378.1 flagellar hook-associated protein 1 FlgK [Nitrosomonas eutropha]
MANSIMNVGVSGLQAAQTALLTTSHNISNATTPGYNRQQAIQSTNTPLPHSNGFIGRGVQVSTVQRIYNQYLVSQSLQAQGQSSQLDSHYNEIKQIDNLLADTTSGLTPALHNFFNAVQDVASNPTSIPSRQAMLSNAEALVSRFQSMDQRLSEMREGVNSQIASSVNEINSLAQQVVRLNTNIQAVEGSANSQPANDLYDQRDALIRDLSKLANVDVVRQSNGHYNVFIGNGQSLVVGTSAMALKAVPSSSDPQRLVVAMDVGDKEILLPEHQLQGGSLGGLLAFRSETLDAIQTDFNQLAKGLADTFNDRHTLGLDLQGTVGKNFFEVTDSNHVARSIEVAISDPAEIAAALNDGGSFDDRVADNRNALQLAKLQTTNTLQGGTASYQSAYASLVSQVGNKTRELEVTSQAQESLLAQTDQAIQSLSGVNLEEEAANLLRYQRMFQASSKVIEISNSLFDSLLRI